MFLNELDKENEKKGEKSRAIKETRNLIVHYSVQNGRKDKRDKESQRTSRQMKKRNLRIKMITITRISFVHTKK